VQSPFKVIDKLLCHQKLLVRFLALYGLGLVLFLLAWTISYYLLPTGILRGRTGAALLAGEAAAGIVLEFVRIASIILALTLLLVVLPNRLLLMHGYPLDYLPPLLWCVFYGVTRDINSFTIPLPVRMAPSVAVLGRSGLYEIAAYRLAATSTHAIARARSRGLFSFTAEPIEPKPNLWASIDWPGLAVALVLLAASAWEAYRIVALA
jgi:hypothetical protein